MREKKFYFFKYFLGHAQSLGGGVGGGGGGVPPGPLGPALQIHRSFLESMAICIIYIVYVSEALWRAVGKWLID